MDRSINQDPYTRDPGGKLAGVARDRRASGADSRPSTPTGCMPEEAPDGFPKALAALEYAQELHGGQRREADGAPFMLHPLEVCCLLFHDGAPDHVIAAGVLHETIEKTEATAEDLRARFGSQVATLVLALTEDRHISDYAQRKAALRDQVATGGYEALIVFAADKISKVRELNLDSDQTRQSWVQSALVREMRDCKLAHYGHCLDLLERLLTDSPLVTQLRRELENAPGIQRDAQPIPGAA
jgi:guanosine-3',5'-bis(diphosphate) 3'-pyrophosphohydrolase